MHESDGRARLGLTLSQLAEQALERGQRAALQAMHLASPVLELTVEIVATVADRGEARRVEIDRMDRGDLLDDALAHASDAIGRRSERLGDPALVHRAVHALHHVELTPEHGAGSFEPERARCAHGVPSSPRRIANWRRRS